MSTFRLLNFGCRASQADGAALKQQLLRAGLREASTFEESQVAILNTCTVTARADAEVRQLVRRIHRQNPGCRILVTGCYAQRAPEEIAQLEGVAWVVGNSHKHQAIKLLERDGYPSQVAAGRVPSAAESAAPGEPGARILVGEIAGEFHFAPAFADDRTRPTLKVQDGCNARCAFCVIPDVRGRSRSLAPEKVIDQVRALAENGYQEVVLSGINLGGYGRDLDRRTSFLGLLERLLAETAIRRLRLSSLEPMDVSPALIRLVAREPRLAQHFHVPLQSGCDQVLRRMNRRYWASQYAERILAIREQIPHCGIGADIMVGFPGETDEEHGTSLRFIESLPFTYLHIFPYSARPGTPAAASPHQVEGRIARERAQEIRALIASKRQAFLAAQVGQRFSALTLHETKADGCLALTTHYLNVLLPHSEISPNRLLDVWVGRVHEGMLHGYPAAQAGVSEL